MDICDVFVKIFSMRVLLWINHGFLEFDSSILSSIYIGR